jgi:hypothetical protein
VTVDSTRWALLEGIVYGDEASERDRLKALELGGRLVPLSALAESAAPPTYAGDRVRRERPAPSGDLEPRREAGSGSGAARGMIAADPPQPCGQSSLTLHPAA